MAAIVENGDEKEKTKKKKDMFKVIIRHLPPYMTWEELKEQLAPLPPLEYVCFCPADFSFSPHAFTRCYLVFSNEADVLEFSEKFNRYVFVDSKGHNSAAMVEMAMYQKVPRKRPEDLEKDNRVGIIENEVEYIKFVDELEAARNSSILTIEEQLRNVQLMETVSKAGSVQDTPLTRHLVKQAEEKAQKREEKRRAMDKFRKPRNEKEKPSPKGFPSTSKDDGDRITGKLGIAKEKDDNKEKRPPPVRTPREKREKVERPLRNFERKAATTDEDKKKNRPEREYYRPGQRSRRKPDAKPDVWTTSAPLPSDAPC